MFDTEKSFEFIYFILILNIIKKNIRLIIIFHGELKVKIQMQVYEIKGIFLLD